MHVLERDDSGWWKGYNGNKVGIFPANLVSINGVPGPTPDSIAEQKEQKEPTKKYNYEVLTKYSELDVNSVPSDVDLNYLEVTSNYCFKSLTLIRNIYLNKNLKRSSP